MLEGILGQDHAIERLEFLLRSERLPHALVFSGPRGVGKCTTALALARVLLDAATGTSHGRLIDAGTHPDLHLVRKEDAAYSEQTSLRRRKQINLPIELIRERIVGGRSGDGSVLDAPVNRTPALATRKVFLVDEAEGLDQPAQNTLLKVLEEPPADTLLVLVTCRPGLLLPTVRSRCLEIRFRRLEEFAMRAWVDRLAETRGEDEVAWIIEQAEGSPGLAATMFEHGFHRWRTRLVAGLEVLHGGGFPEDLAPALNEFVDAFVDHEVKQGAQVSREAAGRSGTEHLLSLLGRHAQRGLSADPVEGRWTSIIDLLDGAARCITSNVNRKQVLENLVAQWSVLPQRGG